jgi:RNA polymerase sigma-70 factor (ECF subfamily)
MLQAKDGDENAFGALFRQHRAPVQRFVRRMLGNAAEAEDVTQEIFLRAFRYRDNYEVTAKFTTWLYRIAGHVTLNWIRDQSRFRRHLPLEPTPGDRRGPYMADPAARIDEWLLFQDLLAALHAAIDELPQRQQEILRLHKFDELECETIAQQLGCSNQAIRSVLFRAYESLRQRLGES